jgi:2-keto-4-pentenoate hydratase/2-oxohepta-3-ene-1,7-dioic acid hydratase in catechol pathway
MTLPTRWARFRSREGRVGFGQFTDDRIVEYAGDVFDAPHPTGATLERGSFKLLAPCTPSKMVALWNNFRALAAKLGKEAPAHPLFLIKPATSIIGPNEEIRRPTGYAGKIAYEGELGIVIGRRCKDVPVGEAPRHIFGYTCVNDVTAADVLNETPDFAQWCRSKGYDTFGCIGPVIATGIDPAQARIVTRLGGVERQNYLLSDMIMSPPELVSRLSHDMTLLPGDVIACGTSLGVGSIRDGAAVEITIDGIGSLTNVLAPAPGGSAPAV